MVLFLAIIIFIASCTEDLNQTQEQGLCTNDIKTCPDGSEVTRILPPNCDFEACPAISDDNQNGISCTQDAKQCPDGSYVSRIPPNCDFAKCPESIKNTTDTITIRGKLISLKCNSDENCALIDGEFLDSFTTMTLCCGTCEDNDYYLDKWISVNKDSYTKVLEELRNENCKDIQGCPGYYCPQYLPENATHIAKCIDNICNKVPK